MSATDTRLRIAVEALERIADERQTSLRWRWNTSGGAVEKPNVRLVADEALAAIDAVVQGEEDQR
jgi:hypothetical protein